MSDKRRGQEPERRKQATEPEPEATPHISPEEGQSSSRLEESREPSENEEKRRVAGKLREQGS
jgi:hypothetical protein